MTDLLPGVRSYAERHLLLSKGAAVIAAVSGGADSLCLLHLLTRLAAEYDLRLHVAHLDHGLRGASSAADAQFVRETAGLWDLPHTIEHLPEGALRQAGVSLEEAARNARYRFLARVADQTGAGVIAVGHHAGDQAETVLMHFLRGSGVAGLRGMLPASRLAAYRLGEGASAEAAADLLLIRPLLGVTRSEIEAYCAEQGLNPRQDETNADTALYRNRLRHELLPFLESYNPGIRAVLGHTAEVMQGDYEVLQGAVEQAWSALERGTPPGEVHFDLSGWRALPVGLQRALVREGVTRLRRHLRDINWVHVERAVETGRAGLTGQSATLAAGLALHVRYDRLVIGPEELPGGSCGPRVTEAAPLTLPGETPLGGGWRLRADLLPAAVRDSDIEHNEDPWTAYLDADAAGSELVVRARLPGDAFKPLGLEGHTAKVNEFMINARIPREERSAWPLLVAPWGVAWLCGLRLDERVRVRPSTTRIYHLRIYKEQASGHHPTTT